MTAKSEPVRAVIYSRVSTDKQVDGTSLSTQKAICRALIEDRKWTLTEEYEDAGISGSGSTRPEWNRLLQAASSGTFQAVFVYDLDRWSRDMNDGMRAIRQLGDAGVQLFDSKNPGIDAASDDAFLATGVGMVVSEQYKRQMVKRTAVGQRAAAAMGRWPGGKPSFGWRLEGYKRDAHAVPDERERAVILTAFDLFVKKRLSTGAVAQRLNELGMHPRFSSHWQYQTVRQTFTNPTLYTGVMVWGSTDRISTRIGSHKTKVLRDGSPKWGPSAEVNMGNPPLSRQQWLSLQRAVNRKAVGHAITPPVQQMLTGRLFGACGKHYNGVSLTARGAAVYRCSGRRHRANGGALKCACAQIDTTNIDGIVWGELAGLLGDPARLEAMAREWLELPVDSDLSDDSSMVAALRKQEVRVERALSRAKDDMYRSDEPDDHRDRIDRFASELAEVRERIAGFESTLAHRREGAQRLTDLAALAERAQGRLVTMPPAQRREVIELLDVRVFVDAIEAGAPQVVKITGSIDPRLTFGADDGRQASSDARPAGVPDPAGHDRLCDLPGGVRAAVGVLSALS